MNKQEREFVEDTIAILMDYDGYREAKDLMTLIDETKQRLIDLLKGDIAEPYKAEDNEKGG